MWEVVGVMIDFLRKLFGCDAENEENKRCEEEQRRYNEEWERATKALKFRPY